MLPAASLVLLQFPPLFGNSGIKFEQDTTVKFDLLPSHNRPSSVLSFQNLSNNSRFLLFAEDQQVGYDRGSSLSNDWLGTCGLPNSTFPEPCSKTFTFQAGMDYTLVLRLRQRDTVYSTDSLNPNGTNQALFSGDYSDLFNPGGVEISFDDGGGRQTTTTICPTPFNQGDCDFQDLKVRATEVNSSVPEPATLAGLGVVAGAIFLSRRRCRYFL
ncbi:PEP-CTERM sorting domain-containing protein [Microseira wollei]|uniref:Ice-binding protein C-terminal domain-containing protein n=1 Tax=Microseira wollei NIES-4236 TaxID=2530354 RepID=A0AAV3XMW0_9CYAN|nr:PEP-CTERM sorting domain-containing protein [Microseira wollei]GET43235.1 hypothetical protein MC7420_185 [Microseira wollei NIES-4236]